MATPVQRIVDSSPLILLAKIGQLDLLHAGVPEVFSSQSAQRVPSLNICAEWDFSGPMMWPTKPWPWSGSSDSSPNKRGKDGWTCIVFSAAKRCADKHCFISCGTCHSSLDPSDACPFQPAEHCIQER